MIRTFIAIDLPEACHQALSELQEQLKGADAPVSWVKVHSIHVTLKFLGNIPEELVPRIQTAMEQVAAHTSPFILQPAGCGAFPSLKQMRIIWAGLGGDAEATQRLQELQREVESAMEPFGFKKEDRPFKPHLTLGRVKGRRNLRALQDIALKWQDFRTEPFKITEIVLYRSDLRPDGSVYTALFRAPFAGRLQT
jgi:2'-5' RNA ligase